jgi:hypothetical protein
MVAPPKKSSSFGVEVVTNASQKKKKRKKEKKESKTEESRSSRIKFVLKQKLKPKRRE